MEIERRTPTHNIKSTIYTHTNPTLQFFYEYFLMKICFVLHFLIIGMEENVMIFIIYLRKIYLQKTFLFRMDYGVHLLFKLGL